MVILLLATPSHAGCELRVGAAALRLDMERAEAMYASADADTLAHFAPAADALAAALPCLGDELRPADVARFLRIQGLAAWLRRADAAVPARVWFAAARAVEPDYAFPEDTISRDDLEYREYLAIVVDNPLTSTLPASAWSSWVNGVETDDVATGWPSIVQWTDLGSVQCTELLPAGASPGCAAPPAEVAGTRKKKSPAVSVGLVAGGAAVLAGGLGWELWNGARREELGLDSCATTEACPYDSATAESLQRDAGLHQVGAIALMAVGGLGLAGGVVSFVVAGDGGLVQVGVPW